AAYTEDFYGGIDIYIYEGVGPEVSGLERRAADLLELYGLSEREALVLLHIVKRGSSSAGEIAKALQLRRVEAYKLVKELAEDNLNQAADRGTKVRLISRVDESTMEAAEGLSNRCELRHSNVTTLGRLSVADTSQTLISLVLDKSLGKRNAKDVAIWSDSGDFAGMMGSLFDTAYRASVPRQGKLRVVGAPEETAE